MLWLGEYMNPWNYFKKGQGVNLSIFVLLDQERLILPFLPHPPMPSIQAWNWADLFIKEKINRETTASSSGQHTLDASIVCTGA